MRATKKNMRDHIITGDNKILHCKSCGAEYSGHAGDYFTYPDNHVFKCADCGIEMELVEKIVRVTYK